MKIFWDRDSRRLSKKKKTHLDGSKTTSRYSDKATDIPVSIWNYLWMSTAAP